MKLDTGSNGKMPAMPNDRPLGSGQHGNAAIKATKGQEKQEEDESVKGSGAFQFSSYRYA